MTSPVRGTQNAQLDRCGNRPHGSGNRKLAVGLPGETLGATSWVEGHSDAPEKQIRAALRSPRSQEAISGGVCLQVQGQKARCRPQRDWRPGQSSQARNECPQPLRPENQENNQGSDLGTEVYVRLSTCQNESQDVGKQASSQGDKSKSTLLYDSSLSSPSLTSELLPEPGQS